MPKRSTLPELDPLHMLGIDEPTPRRRAPAQPSPPRPQPRAEAPEPVVAPESVSPKVSAPEPVQPPSETPTPSPRATLRLAPEDTRKHKLTVAVSLALANEVRNCVAELMGEPHRMTMARFAEEAFSRELARLKRTLKKGEGFDQRTAELAGGRRPKVVNETP